MPSRRLFVAIELPAEVQVGLQTLIAALRQRVPGGVVRWARPEGTHLTLQFYGAVTAARQIKLEAALRDGAQGRRPLHLTARTVSAFPRPGAARVLWVGVDGDLAALRDLHGQIMALSEMLGFATEARGFTPHLTVGRVRPDAGRERLALIAAALSEQAAWQGPGFVATQLSLFQSEPHPDGAVYTRLGATGIFP